MADDPHLPLIRRLAPDEDPAQIAEWMRRKHDNLDNVDPIDFAREVKRAVKSIHARRPSTAPPVTPADAVTPDKDSRR